MHAIAMRKFISRKFNNIKWEMSTWFPVVSLSSMLTKYVDKTVDRMGVKMGSKFKTINQQKCKLHQISPTKVL